MINDLILRNRSYRKFDAGFYVSKEMLTSFINLARQTPSSKNKQPLKYILVNEKKQTDFLFDQLSWAKHLKDWPGPSVEERPSAYIVMLLDTKINSEAMIDAGIAAQTILLAAVEKGLGGCIIRSVNRQSASTFFKLPSNLQIIQVIAVGKPKQTIKLVDVKDGKTEYYTGDHGEHCVPKRSLEEVIFYPEID